MRPEGTFSSATEPQMTEGLLHGRYEPGESLGEGGVFDVSRGRDVQSGRLVALKTLGAEFGGDPEFARRLREEAERSAVLSHPGIVPVIDVWDEHGRTHLATEYVRGINLAERIRRLAPFPLAVAIDPLDGSSNIGVNMAVGTIFGIRPAVQDDANPIASFATPGTAQLAAGFVTYGPATALVLTSSRRRRAPRPPRSPSRRDDAHGREVGRVPAGVAGEQGDVRGGGVCADVEVRERRGPRPSVAPVLDVCLPYQEPRLPRQLRPPVVLCGKRSLEVFDPGERTDTSA